MKSVLLRGLQAQSLASYLAALGILRLYSEQLDLKTRGAWSSQGFVLYGVSESELLSFLLDQYRPTALVAPWAGGSGFSEGEDSTAIDAISRSTDNRLVDYRRVIEQVRKFPELPPRGLLVREVKEWAETKLRTEAAKKNPSSKLIREFGRLLADLSASTGSDDERVEDCKQGHPAAKIFTQLKSERRASAKSSLAARCRNQLPDECLAWIDTSLILFVDGKGEIDQVNGPLSKDAVKPKLEFSRLFMQAICATILSENRTTVEHWARSLLTGETTHSLPSSAVGLFELGPAGGFNTGPGFEHKDLPNNPWRIAMTFEGVVAWSGSVSRRASVSSVNMATVGPFTTRHIPAGMGSATDSDRKVALTELWAPLWSRPASAREVIGLISEGRARIDGREPRNAIEFSQAVSSLGVDRGVTSFVRFAIAERRGPSYMATPVGTFDVRIRREVDLLSQLDRELDLLDEFFRGFPSEQGPPVQLVSLRRAIDDARLDVAVRGGPDAMIRLVRSIGALEMVIARRDPGKDPKLYRPLGGLGSEWVEACGDAVEVRIAAALAAVARTGGAGPMRAYLAPLDPNDSGRYAPTSRPLVWAGVDFVDRLGSALQRRLLDVSTRSNGDVARRRNPTWGVRRASLDNVAAFLSPDSVDDRAIEELLFGFTWVKPPTARISQCFPPASPPLSRCYALLKLLFLPNGVPRADEHVHLVPDTAIIPLLRGGRVTDAVELASRQLNAKGLLPRRVIDGGIVDTALGRRLAAALLIPITDTKWLVDNALLPLALAETEIGNNEKQEMTDAR